LLLEYVMAEERIAELEAQLVTANDSVTNLTKLNSELTERLSDAEARNKKLKRSSRRDEQTHKDSLLAAQMRK
jgi:hypothetical protein